MRKFALSDIHGCRATFEALLDRIRLSTGDQLYLLGDYVDRGPDSRGVIDLIWRLQREGYQVFCLMGNHEWMMIDAADGNGMVEEKNWMNSMGRETMTSFAAGNLQEVPRAYIDWMANLPYFFEVDNYLLVHAGLNFFKTDPLADFYSMIWIREWYESIDYEWLGRRMIVHGHTPIGRSGADLLLQKLSITRVLNIDTGCVFSRRNPSFGYLTAFDLTNHELIHQLNVE